MRIVPVLDAVADMGVPLERLVVGTVPGTVPHGPSGRWVVFPLADGSACLADGISCADSASAALRKMQEAGYEMVSDPKNSWGSDGYQGVNSTWRDPTTGQTFEVQLHTAESLAAKEAAHPLYEQARLLPQGSPERLALEAKQDEVFRRVPRPAGAADVGARPQVEQ